MNPNDYDEDGNNIVPCPLCSSTNCPYCYEDGKCPEEEAYARDMEKEMKEVSPSEFRKALETVCKNLLGN